MKAIKSRIPKSGGRWSIATFLSLILALVFLSGEAAATHFRSGQIFWRPLSGTTIEFVLQDTFRRSLLPFTAYSCRDQATLAVKPCSAPDGLPAIGDVFLEDIGDTVFLPGDGSVIGNPIAGCPNTFCLLYQVTAIDPVDQWLFAEALDPASLPVIDRTIEHTYPGPGEFLAVIDSGDRIERVQPPNEHINNPEGTYRVETIVDVGSGNSSPVSALPAIVKCPINALCEFLVPSADADEDLLSFRLSSSAEASSFDPFVQPGPPDAPNAASIDSMTGLYTWDTVGATLATNPSNNTLYSTQVTIEDPTSKVAVDFLIQLVEEDLDPPVIEPPQGFPPICETTQVITVGTTRTFDVIGSDADPDDVVTLNVVGLPTGAQTTPSLPVAGNPVSSTFSWTPDSAQVGMFVINFSASSTGGGFTLCPVTLDVVEKITLDIDVKPRSRRNIIDLDDDDVCEEDDDGRLLVAVFGTPTFDPSTIDRTTLELGDPQLSGTSAPIRSRMRDINRDGRGDLLLVFSLCNLVTNSALDRSSTELMLTGATQDGVPVMGTDAVTVFADESDKDKDGDKDKDKDD